MIGMDMVSNTFKLAAGKHFGASALYASLAEKVSEDDKLLAVARHARTGSFPPFLFFTAIHSILLRDRNEELGQFFQTVSRKPTTAGDPYPLLRDFVRRHFEEIMALIRSANVNKSVIHRSACLRAMLAKVAAEMDWKRIHLVDMGCGVGFNLLMDRWRISYSDCGNVGPSDSPVRFSVAVKGPGIPSLEATPEIISRTGIDIDVFDLTDDAHLRWLQGGLFPEQLEVLEVQERAFGVLRQEAPRIVKGDAGVELSNILADLSGADPVVVTHSLMMHQLKPAQRQMIFRALQQTAGDRPVVRLGMELGRAHCVLAIAHCNGTGSNIVGEADDDAAWMRWY